MAEANADGEPAAGVALAMPDGDGDTDADAVGKPAFSVALAVPDEDADADADSERACVALTEGLDNAEPLTLALAGMLGDMLALGVADGDAEALRPSVADVDADAN